MALPFLSRRSGKTGEDAAASYLEAKGLAILARNVRFRFGEIDLVARDGECVAFVEVKERGGDGHGTGAEAVTAGKRRRMARAAQAYAARHGLTESAMRFDVVTIDLSAPKSERIRHFPGAFNVDGR